jgi:hypothetical protein
VLGIVVTRAVSAGVVGNTVARVGLTTAGARIRAGILLFAVDGARVGGNVVDTVGTPDGFLGLALGIGVVGPFDDASVQDNSSRFSADRPGPAQGDWYALVVSSAGGEFTSFGGGNAVVPTPNGAVVLTGAWAFVAAARADHAGVGANSLTGGGTQPTCLVRVAGEVVAEGNRVFHQRGEQPAGILVQATAATVATNRVRGPEPIILLQVPAGRFAAVGNLAAGGTHLNNPGAGLPAPWSPLNPTVP